MRDDINKNEEERPICLDCGAELVEKDGELVCPYCDVEIDYFGENEEEEETESFEELYDEELEETFSEEDEEEEEF